MIRNFTVSPPSGILMPNIMKTQIIDIVDTLDNFRRIDFCDGWQSFENSNLYYWGCKGSMSNFCSDLILCLWNVQFLSCPPKDDGFPNRASCIFLSDEILTLSKNADKERFPFLKGANKNLRVWIPVILRGVQIKK